ncbi:MAG TPA: hypothetical protein VGT41_06405 [Candidatus Babeliales bacterium]|nr:hypothetical protein [Candidatus Babeliales bacterium]
MRHIILILLLTIPCASFAANADAKPPVTKKLLKKTKGSQGRNLATSLQVQANVSVGQLQMQKQRFDVIDNGPHGDNTIHRQRLQAKLAQSRAKKAAQAAENPNGHEEQKS